MSNHFWLATYDSRNFEFQGVGATRLLALQALRRGLLKHQDQYQTTKFWGKLEDEATIQLLALGAGYRDQTVIATQVQS